MISAIAKRKSIRSFKDTKVEAEKVERILRAAIILVYVGQMLGQNDTFFLFFHIKFLWKI